MTMQIKPDFDSSFAALAMAAETAPSEGFLYGIWQRAGQLQERANRRQRLALFCGLFVIGLGAGFGTNGTGVVANPASLQISSADRLSPSALLHVAP
ncbi:hypothetical protein [Alteraurantiacibacter buctensis]|uniref:Uncharacterized protein n=1 Tax=Alteraurantiacibacter buctensis TaxID=1503981 RepID=A0A844Z2Q8_9SPHN|nr:hypothetical protein [Alteraurantiacibacter buctensis]MXO73496.1 hypothetical protein [Alteraurantiacibacter buctensis]